MRASSDSSCSIGFSGYCALQRGDVGAVEQRPGPPSLEYRKAHVRRRRSWRSCPASGTDAVPRAASSTSPTARATAAGGSSSRPKVSARKNSSSVSVVPSMSAIAVRVHRHRQVALHRVEPADESVVHPQPVPRRNGWQFVCCTGEPIAARMCAKTPRRRDVSRELTQVAVVPGRLDAAEHAGRRLGAVPADAETVAVRRLRAQGGVHALHDQRVLGLVEQVLQEDR